ncbi:MAG: invasion associated locus B family protein [Hyphomicrobiaceae bacterium]
MAGQSFTQMRSLGKYAVAGIAAAMLALGAAAMPAAAQTDGDGTAKKDKAGEKVSLWVKLCEKAQLKKEDKDKKEICITHQEQLDRNTGGPMVSAAIRTTEGLDVKRFLVTVPLGMAIPAGAQIKIDDQKEPTKLAFTYCFPNGCTAEVEATEDLMKSMMTGQNLMVSAISVVGEQVLFKLPLSGFKESYEGKPVDTAQFANVRRQYLLKYREALIQKAKKADQEKKNKKKDDKAGTDGAAAPAEGEQQ